MSEVAFVVFDTAAFDELVCRAREHGLSLAESRILEWHLRHGGAASRPHPSPSPATPRARSLADGES